MEERASKVLKKKISFDIVIDLLYRLCDNFNGVWKVKGIRKWPSFEVGT